uniref:Uncharacterized protein n=1 Tax=Arundo donax TaxID=35708 RepID=A0A0A9DEQ8_ARUDO
MCLIVFCGCPPWKRGKATENPPKFTSFRISHQPTIINRCNFTLALMKCIFDVLHHFKSFCSLLNG